MSRTINIINVQQEKFEDNVVDTTLDPSLDPTSLKEPPNASTTTTSQEQIATPVAMKATTTDNGLC
jgi:hypothetical protein